MLLGYGTDRGCGALGQVPRLRIASVLPRRVSGARPPRAPHHPVKVAENVVVQWGAQVEVVTGSRLVLLVALSTSRWGRHFRRALPAEPEPGQLSERVHRDRAQRDRDNHDAQQPHHHPSAPRPDPLTRRATRGRRQHGRRRARHHQPIRVAAFMGVLHIIIPVDWTCDQRLPPNGRSRRAVDRRS
jgi:hypothetical protein